MELDPVEDSGSQMEGNWIIRNIKEEIKNKIYMSNIFTRMTFWTKLQLTIQAILSLAQLSLIFGDSAHVYNVFVTAGQILILIIPIWVSDTNRDGIVDGFEKEVVTTIKSDSPIIVETEVKKDIP